MTPGRGLPYSSRVFSSVYGCPACRNERVLDRISTSQVSPVTTVSPLEVVSIVVLVFFPKNVTLPEADRTRELWCCGLRCALAVAA